MELTQREKNWIKDEIETEVRSIRIDNDPTDTVTFDKKNFTQKDYPLIAMLEDLYEKVASRFPEDSGDWTNKNLTQK